MQPNLPCLPRRLIRWHLGGSLAAPPDSHLAQPWAGCPLRLYPGHCSLASECRQLRDAAGEADRTAVRYGWDRRSKVWASALIVIVRSITRTVLPVNELAS